MPTEKQLANLKPPINLRDEQREIRRKGGIKSGEVRRQLKTFKELLNEQLSEENINKKTLKEAITNRLLKLALNGNLKAIEMVRDTIGEKPIERQEITNNTPVNVKIDLKKLKSIRDKLEKY